jgi:hypothetical protein
VLLKTTVSQCQVLNNILLNLANNPYKKILHYIFIIERVLRLAMNALRNNKLRTLLSLLGLLSDFSIIAVPFAAVDLFGSQAKIWVSLDKTRFT